MSGPNMKGSELGWPWVFQWPSEGGVPLPRYAPERLWQPINPGWTFGNVVVNSINSTAPEVEQAIALEVSYGREIGVISDARRALLEVVVPNRTEGKESVKKFKEVAASINDIKNRHKASRLKRLKDELDELKRTDPKAWEKLVS